MVGVRPLVPLCVTTAPPLDQGTLRRAMRAAIVHRVSTIGEFVAVVEEYDTRLLLATPQGRERFRGNVHPRAG